MRITFVITGLGGGGAETMLCKLLSRIDRERFVPRVISLTCLDTLAPQVERMGVPIEFLGMHPGIPDPRGLLRLAGLLRRQQPDLVQTWMYHADLLGGLAAKAAGRVPVLWNIRNGTLAPGASKRSTLLTARACARLSWHLPSRIVCCAEEARRIHVGFGYDPSRFTVIPNGFDTSVLRPDPKARQAVRRELGWDEDAMVVGLVARFHPQKDHSTFFAAAGHLALKNPKARFLLCGEGVTEANPELTAAIVRHRLGGKVRLLGHRPDVGRLTAALDVAVSSSYSGEAFSNILGEAMACGVPCVATRVGDAQAIVGDTGRIVGPRSAGDLAAAIEELLAASPERRAEFGKRARQRVIKHYSLEAVANHYQALYSEFAPRAPGTVSRRPWMAAGR